MRIVKVTSKSTNALLQKRILIHLQDLIMQNGIRSSYLGVLLLAVGCLV